MSRTGRIVGVLLLIGGVSAGLGGCNKVNKTDYDAAVSENQDLRDRLAQEQKARQEAETRSASLEQENHDLANHADKPGGNSKGMGADTGFSGIEGATAYRTAGGEVVVSVAGDVLFDSGKATLKTSAKKSLDKIASVIKGQYSGHMIRVEGYTDSDPLVKTKGKWGNNERLSGERALAVEEYLTSRGLSKDQIYYAGFGPSRPKGNKKESRRVEIVILASKG